LGEDFSGLGLLFESVVGGRQGAACVTVRNNAEKHF